MKKKYCKDCKILVKENTCPVCSKSGFTENFQGRLFVTDAKGNLVKDRYGNLTKLQHDI